MTTESETREACVEGSGSKDIRRETVQRSKTDMPNWCTTLLFTNTGNSISWFILNWMGDIEKLSSYNWALAMHEWLLDALVKKESQPSSMTGCTILLLVLTTGFN